MMFELLQNVQEKAGFNAGRESEIHRRTEVFDLDTPSIDGLYQDEFQVVFSYEYDSNNLTPAENSKFSSSVGGSHTNSTNNGWEIGGEGGGQIKGAGIKINGKYSSSTSNSYTKTKSSGRSVTVYGYQTSVRVTATINYRFDSKDSVQNQTKKISYIVPGIIYSTTKLQ